MKQDVLPAPPANLPIRPILPVDELKGFLLSLVLGGMPVGIFTDWLEDRGDGRADAIRQFGEVEFPSLMSYGSDWKLLPGALALISLFPEVLIPVKGGELVFIPGEVSLCPECGARLVAQVLTFGTGRWVASFYLDCELAMGPARHRHQYLGRAWENIREMTTRWAAAFLRKGP